MNCRQFALGFLAAGWLGVSWAECTIDAAARSLDPVEVGFCESDAVFVGKVANRMQTARAYREEGSEQTKHYLIETSTVETGNQFKGTVANKVILTANLYDKQGAFSFALGKEYLIFAKRLPSGEYAGASTACSVQPTVKAEEAASALEQLERHAKGKQKIDCKNIRPKSASSPQ